MKIEYVHASLQYVSSYCQAVKAIAEERKYLASTIGFPEETVTNYVKETVKKNLAQYYAIDSDVVVGWCDIFPKSYEGLDHVGVLGMGVLSSHRHNGIGKKLMELTLKHAKEINNLEKVELEVFKSNINAITLYKDAGFNVEGERINSRKLDGVYDNIILMGRIL